MLKRDSAALLLADSTISTLAEIDFWKAQHTNLVSLFQQLNSPKMVKMRALLLVCLCFFAMPCFLFALPVS